MVPQTCLSLPPLRVVGERASGVRPPAAIPRGQAPVARPARSDFRSHDRSYDPENCLPPRRCAPGCHRGGSVSARSQDVEAVDVDEHGVVGDQLEVEAKGGGGDPAVGLVDLLAQRVAVALRSGPQ